MIRLECQNCGEVSWEEDTFDEDAWRCPVCGAINSTAKAKEVNPYPSEPLLSPT